MTREQFINAFANAEFLGALCDASPQLREDLVTVMVSLLCPQDAPQTDEEQERIDAVAGEILDQVWGDD